MNELDNYIKGLLHTHAQNTLSGVIFELIKQLDVEHQKNIYNFLKEIYK